LCVPVLANTDEESAPGGSSNHVAIQHKAQPAKHPHFPHRAGPGENHTHAISEVFIQSHGPALEHGCEFLYAMDSRYSTETALTMFR
jgi:hypothetical protein